MERISFFSEYVFDHVICEQWSRSMGKNHFCQLNKRKKSRAARKTVPSEHSHSRDTARSTSRTKNAELGPIRMFRILNCQESSAEKSEGLESHAGPARSAVRRRKSADTDGECTLRRIEFEHTEHREHSQWISGTAVRPLGKGAWWRWGIDDDSRHFEQKLGSCRRQNHKLPQRTHPPRKKRISEAKKIERKLHFDSDITQKARRRLLEPVRRFRL